MDDSRLFAANKAALTSSQYASLLKPVDIYAPPPSAKMLITVSELFKLVKTQGVVLKVAKEQLNTAKQTQKSYEAVYIPTLTLGAGASKTWNSTRTDSDLTDEYSDRDLTVGSSTRVGNLGLTLNGTLLKGLTYSLSTPEYSTTKPDPDLSTENPRRSDRAGWTAKIDLALLKDGTYFVQSAQDKKQKLEWTLARETYRAEMLKAINSAEKSYYSLIKSYLQLVIQQRAHELAKALESDVKEKITAGESSNLEAMRASLQTSQSETDLMASQIDYEAAIEDFRNSLSFNGADGDGLFPDPKSINLNLDTFKAPNASFLNELKRGNTDISLAKLASSSAELDLEIARTNRLPSLSMSTSYANGVPGERFGQVVTESFKSNDRVISFGLTYSQILFNDPSINSYKQAIVTKQKAVFSLDQAEKNLTKSFNGLTKRLEIGGRRLKIAKISREIAEKKLESEYEKFRFGESSVRNVIDSQSEVNSARITEIGARIDLLLGSSDLRTIAGKLPEGVSIVYGSITGNE